MLNKDPELSVLFIFLKYSFQIDQTCHSQCLFNSCSIIYFFVLIKVGHLKRLILIWEFRLCALKIRLLRLWLKFGRNFLGWSREKQNELFYTLTDRCLARLEKAENKFYGSD